MIKRFLYIFILFYAGICAGQDEGQTAVKTSVDRDLIKIGEEVKLNLSLEVSASDLVIFPEQPTMGALEVIESYPVDSLIENDKLRLFKQYGVTQWDSGDYWLPRLNIIKNEARLQSDSVLISVREVAVDTTKQKMFPIKPALQIEDRADPSYVWLLWLLLVICLGGLIFLLSRKREKKSYEETLLPFEWAKYRLQKLDESSYLEQREWKAYYTELTYILRRYIDSKVYGHTLESTTGQLIKELKTAMNEKGMQITEGTQARLEEVLRKADLVKFASAGGDAISAKEDRQHTNNIIDNIHQVLPPPTEEELMQDARYRRKQEIKKRSKQIALGVIAAIVVVGMALSAWAYVEGWNEVKDKVLGNELREAYEQDWLTSTYGVPQVQLTTPDILVREDEVAIPDQLQAAVGAFDNFELGSLGDEYYIQVTTMNFDQELPEDLEASAFTDPIIQMLEKEGATNILMLDDQVEINGTKGIELSGDFLYEEQSYRYSILMFSKAGGLQQISLITRAVAEENEDRQFGRLMIERIKNSIQIKELQTKKKKQP